MKALRRNRWKPSCFVSLILLLPLIAVLLLTIAGTMPARKDLGGSAARQKRSKAFIPDDEITDIRSPWDNVSILVYDWAQWWQGDAAFHGDIQVITPEINVSQEPAPGIPEKP